MHTTHAGERPSSFPNARNILVVEDERPVRELLQVHLQNAGYGVVAAPDAVVAGHLLVSDAAKFDLVIIDAHLPYLSGIEFASVLIADSSIPPLPIILITGHEELASRADILDVPCLIKPFSADELLAIVERNIVARAPVSAAGVREHGISKLLQQHERRVSQREQRT